MPDEELAQLIRHGREERNLEYKQSMNWDAPITKAKIAKSAMAMANIRDGGNIVLGVEEQEETYNLVGMSDDDVNSFKQDDVSTYINGKYADPYIELNVSPVDYDNKHFIVIQIKEFDQMPVVSKSSGEENIKEGGIYTRSRRRYETILVPSQTEMREILDLAIQKSMDKEIVRLRSLCPVSQPPAEEDVGLFNEQLGDL